MLLVSVMTMWATSVKIAMNSNATSTTMKMREKATGNPVAIGEPANKVYTFDVPAGEYIVTGYSGTTDNGDIDLIVGEDDLDLKLFTATAYATNTGWEYGTDYTMSVRVSSREGVNQNVTIGNSSTAGRKTFMMWNGNSYYARLIPTAKREAEKYMTVLKNGTITGNVTVSASIPVGLEYSIMAPADAHLYVGQKTSHFIQYEELEPTSVTMVGSQKKYTYRMANAQVYNYRTWKDGQMTLAGYFTFSSTPEKMPVLNFTDADYTAYNPKQVNHSVLSNGGYETGDIFVNINKNNYLKMQVGDSYDAFAQRTWQLTDNSTNNYYMDPCFHYTVYDLDGNIDNSVIEIDNANTTTNPWATIRAKAAGTAIVTVTYDAINLNYYSSVTKTPYMGGENWGAIWPENTAVYVVSVGAADNAMVPNMVINQEYNLETLKLSGKYVDAEHDVFYYINDEEYAEYSFSPADVATVEIMYPTIRTNDAIYNTGFHAVAKNNDGSYTLHLKHGRQIVRMGDGHGNYEYQVLTAKHATREIKVYGRQDASFFMPGDQITIQYDGLFHPANKLSGIYNMSAYITYNGVPNGSSLILGSGQYTFGSAASAQAVTLTIPSEWDVNDKPNFVLDDGCIQVNGYGDPIGNHRNISRSNGRNANFTAIAHKTYFGQLPTVTVPVILPPTYYLTVSANLPGVTIKVTDYNDVEVAPDAEGRYQVTYGQAHYRVSKPGYKPYVGSVVITNESEQITHVEATLTLAAANSWDGETLTAPTKSGDYYQIYSGYHYAWFVNEVNKNKKYTIKAKLMNDIDLGDEPISPIGGNAAGTAFKGEFDGQGFTITGLNIIGTTTYIGMFGHCATAGTQIHDFTVYGKVSGTKNYVAGVCAYMGGVAAKSGLISNVKSYIDVYGEGNYVAGICGYLGIANVENCENHGTITTDYINASTGYVAGVCAYSANAKAVVSNCFNTGTITGVLYASGIVGQLTTGIVENCYNVGTLVCANNAGSIYAVPDQASKNINNCYANKGYSVEEYSTLVTDAARWQSGEVAYLLGDAFGQEIGGDALPVLGGKEVKESGVGTESYYTSSFITEDDNTEVMTEAAGKTTTVALMRGLDADVLYTFCVPFSIPAEEVTKAFGEGTEIWCLTGSEDRGSLIHIDFARVNSIEAGVPYLIRPTEDFEKGMIIEHVTMENTTGKTVGAATDYVQMHGFVNKKEFVGKAENYFLGEDDYLHRVGVDMTVPGLRVYFTFGSNAPASRRAKIVLGGQVTTSIEKGIQTADCQKILRDGQLMIQRGNHLYNMQGQLMK